MIDDSLALSLYPGAADGAAVQPRPERDVEAPPANAAKRRTASPRAANIVEHSGWRIATPDDAEWRIQGSPRGLPFSPTDFSVPASQLFEGGAARHLRTGVAEEVQRALTISDRWVTTSVGPEHCSPRHASGVTRCRSAVSFYRGSLFTGCRIRSAPLGIDPRICIRPGSAPHVFTLSPGPSLRRLRRDSRLLVHRLRSYYARVWLRRPVHPRLGRTALPRRPRRSTYVRALRSRTPRGRRPARACRGSVRRSPRGFLLRAQSPRSRTARPRETRQ